MKKLLLVLCLTSPLVAMDGECDRVDYHCVQRFEAELRGLWTEAMTEVFKLNSSAWQNAGGNHSADMADANDELLKEMVGEYIGTAERLLHAAVLCGFQSVPGKVEEIDRSIKKQWDSHKGDVASKSKSIIECVLLTKPQTMDDVARELFEMLRGK